MNIEVKTFKELTKEEVYDILKLRSDVFVFEQQSPYQDIDGRDFDCIHMILKENGEMKAYLRVLGANTYFKEPSIGRIVCKEKKKGYGSVIMKYCLQYCKEILNYQIIRIEAQVQAIKFYEKLGFKVCTEKYDDYGVMHVQMLINL